eukprot:11168270-Alexandrium_andersonii.AAC.1
MPGDGLRGVVSFISEAGSETQPWLARLRSSPEGPEERILRRVSRRDSRGQMGCQVQGVARHRVAPY